MLTKAMVDAFLVSTAAAGGNPSLMLVGGESLAIFNIIMRADAEGWDRRRLKREARKGSRSTYRKR